MAVVEHDDKFDLCDEAAARIGLKRLHQNGENVIYVEAQ
jgi:hypothetical protein